MIIDYRDGHIQAFDNDGIKINGVKHITLSLTEGGMSEACLFFDRVELQALGVKRASDGVRETRPEPEH